MTPALTTIVVGICCLLSGCCVGIQQILLSPQAVNYPKAGLAPRTLMFVWMASLMGRGVDLLVGVYAGQPQYLGVTTLPASIVLVAVQAALVYNILTRWAPAQTWARFNRIIALAACKPWQERNFAAARRRSLRAVDAGVVVARPVSARQAKAAVADLAMQGAHVAGPNEREFGGVG